MRSILFIFITLIVHVRGTSQHEEIIIDHDPSGSLYALQTLGDESNVYQVCRRFGISINSLIEANPNLEFNSMKDSDTFFLPIDPSMIQVEQDNRTGSVPVYYFVKRQETAYSIARTILQKNLESLLRLNDKADSSLNVGEKLLVGWITYRQRETINTALLQKKEMLPVTGKYEEDLSELDKQPLEVAVDDQPTDEPIIQDLNHPAEEVASGLEVEPEWNDEETDRDTVVEEPIKLVRRRGIAIWEEDDNQSGELLVIHPSARLYTEITLVNPMMGRTVNALVVGHIPEKTYPEEISVVISRDVADALGALDRRFIVDMTYIE